MKDLSDERKETRILKALCGLALLAALLSGICCATGLSTRSAGGRIKVFELGQRIPRNSKILDVLDKEGYWELKYLAGEWSQEGSCSYRAIIRHLKKEAKARGGDALAILYAQRPFRSTAGQGFPKDSCFRIKAFLLDMIDISNWPRLDLTEEEIRRDLDAGGRMLDDIEGIWDSRVHSEVLMDRAALGWAGVNESSQNMGCPYFTGGWRVLPSVIQAMEQLQPEEQSLYRVAIVKTTDDLNYPYAAYILDPDIPEWKPGFLKARLRKKAEGSGYEAKWYGSTFQDDLREFHLDETGALTTKVVIEQGLKYAIEQTLTKVYSPQLPASISKERFGTLRPCMALSR